MSDNPNPYRSTGNLGESPQPKRTARLWMVLGVMGILVLLVLLLLPSMRFPRSAAKRNQCLNNLKQIGLALHSYHDVYHALPPAYTVDANGKPLHSWRTLILPFLEEQELYASIDLSKPWNDPANAAAYNTDVYHYACPETAPTEFETTYLAIVAPAGCFHPSDSRRFEEITDGPSRTLMVVEVPAAQSVHWMSPRDASETMLLAWGPDTQLAHGTGFHAVFADAHVSFLAGELSADKRRALISIAGNDDASEF